MSGTGLVSQHDHGHVGLDRLDGNPDPVRLVREHLRVGVAVTVAAVGADLAADLGSRDPGRAVRPHAVRAVDVGAAAVTRDRRLPHSLRQRAQHRREHHLALLPVGEDGPVGRERTDHRPLRDDEVDRAHRTRREPALRVEEVLECDPDRRLRIERRRVDAGSRLPGGAAEVDLRAAAALPHRDADEVLLVVAGGVAVDQILAHPGAVGDRRQRRRHPLGGGVAGVGHRPMHRRNAVPLDRLAEQPLAEVELGDDGQHVRREDLAEADVVEDQAPRVLLGLSGAVERARGRARARSRRRSSSRC